MKASEAYERLTTRVNVEFYIGPHVAKVIKDACAASDEAKIPTAKESKATTTQKKGS